MQGGGKKDVERATVLRREARVWGRMVAVQQEKEKEKMNKKKKKREFMKVLRR